MMTLREKLDANRGVGPGFHFMRHALAVLIMIHHSYVLSFGGVGNTGYVKGAVAAQIGHLSMQQMAIELVRPGLYSLVGAFFALSGFLVVGSALRTRHAGRFFWFRFIRITPALCVEVTLSSIILGGLFTQLDLGSYYKSPDFLAYFGNIFGFVHYGLPGVFLDNPISGIVNVNLWTLPAEFYCYLFMIAMMLAGLVFDTKRYNLAFLVVLALTIGLSLAWPDRFPPRFDTTHYSVWFIVYLFFVGIFFYLNAARIPLHAGLFAFAALAFWLITLLNLSDVAASFCLAYCVVYVGTLRFARFDRTVKGDYSYGIYLYGYPITQALIALLLPILDRLHGPLRLLAVTPAALALTLCLAYLSWHGVEKQMLKFKNLRLPGLIPGRAADSTQA